MSERELQAWEARQREKRDQAVRTIESAFDDLRMLEDWSRRTPAYEVECSCGRRLSVRSKADAAHEARTNEVAALRAQLAVVGPALDAARAVGRLFSDPNQREFIGGELWAELDTLATRVRELEAGT